MPKPNNHNHNHNPNGFYASLVGPFLGLYCEIPGAQSDTDARYMCNQDRRMQPVWCAIYTLEQVEDLIVQHGGQIIPIRQLDAHHWEDRQHG